MPLHPTTGSRRGLDLLSVLALGALLCSSAVDEFARDDDARGPAPELRTAAPYPRVPRSLAELSSWPSRYDAHYRDTFGLRDVLLRGKTLVEYFGLGVGPSADLVVGRDGWIFFAGDATFETLRGLRPLSFAELEAWRTALESRRDALATLDCRYFYVIGPNKETIYPERLPAHYTALGPSRLEQLAEHLRAHPSIDFLDLRAVLMAERAGDRGDDTTYPPYGTHWTGRGGFAAYRAITQQLTRWFPTLRAYELAECKEFIHEEDSDSWDGKMYVEDLMWQPERVFMPRDGWKRVRVASAPTATGRTVIDTVPDGDGPRAIVCCDSFVEAVQDLLSDSFSDVLYVVGGEPSLSEIVNFRPDVLIDLHVERQLACYPPPSRMDDMPAPTDAEARFEDARTLLFKLDPASPSAGFALHGSARATHTPRGLELFASAPTDEVVTPPLEIDGRQRVWLCMEATNHSGEPLDVYWKQVDEPKFMLSQRTSLHLGATREKRTLALPLPPGRIVLQFRPRFEQRGKIVIHALELRTL